MSSIFVGCRLLHVQSADVFLTLLVIRSHLKQFLLTCGLTGTLTERRIQLSRTNPCGSATEVLRVRSLTSGKAAFLLRAMVRLWWRLPASKLRVNPPSGIISRMAYVGVIRFVYSDIYDRVMAEMLGEYSSGQACLIQSQIGALRQEWMNYEATVIKMLHDYEVCSRSVDSVVCYVVSKLPYTGFSDPLTIRLRDGADLDLVIATLIHELVHIALDPAHVGIDEVKNGFVTDSRTQLHIVVNFIQLAIMETVFGERRLAKVMKRELALKGLREAWHVVLNHRVELARSIRTRQ